MKSSIRRKASNPHRNNAKNTRKGLLFFIAFTLITMYSFSQTAAYLDFRNPVLESGVAATDGAQYRFSTVTTNVDAVITIIGRSDALVNLLNPDMNTSGFDGAFQPQVGYNNGTAPGPADWWMEFNIQFVEHGTSIPATISEFNVSGVDIDGNSQYISEYLSFFDMQDYSIEANSGLTVTSLYESINGSMLSGKRFDGPVANYTNIDTGATNVMVSNHYVNKSSFTVRTGGKSTDVSGASDRMYSFYFQNFAYNNPHNSLLASNRVRITRERINTAVIPSVYPNPVSSTLFIKLADVQTKNTSIRLYDVKGNLVTANMNTSDNGQQLDVSKLKAGMYILQIVAGEEKSLQRIVKM